MYYYTRRGRKLASFSPLPLPAAPEPGENEEVTFLIDCPPEDRRASFLAADPRHLTAQRDSVEWLDSRRIDAPEPELPEWLARRLKHGGLRAVNFRHPAWERVVFGERRQPNRKRVNLLAVAMWAGRC